MPTKTEVEGFHGTSRHPTMITLPESHSIVSNRSRGGDHSWSHHPSKRSRSRAIPIKRGRPSLAQQEPSRESHDRDDDPTWSEDESDMERMYDWSTWRLYHRILEHREKHPLTASYYHDVEHSQSAGGGGSAPSTSRGREVASRASHVHFEKSPLEGEVFELEL
jgi:hypothetical protein